MKLLKVVENSNYENDVESMGEYLVVDNKDIVEFDGDERGCNTYILCRVIDSLTEISVKSPTREVEEVILQLESLLTPID